MFAVNSRRNGNIDVEVPYTAAVPFLDATHVSSSNFTFTAGSTTKYLLKSVADDFQLLFLRAYPYGTLTSNGSTGTRGMVAWGYA